MAGRLCIQLFCLVLLQSFFATFCYKNATDVIRSISKHADRRVRPYGNADGQLSVLVSMTINGLEINEKTLDYTMDAYFRLKWKDERLKFDANDRPSLTLTPTIADQFLWKPDVFFSNAHEGFQRSEKFPTYGARLSPNGDVLYTTKITLHSKCQAHFHKYPMDSHNCSLKVESYMSTMEDVLLGWDRVVLSKVLHVPMFTVLQYGVEEINEILNTGTYQRLNFWFIIKRENRALMALTVLPSLLLVCLSCLLFWLPLSALNERTIFSTMLLLIVTVIAMASRQGAPPAGHLTALDIWFLGCFIFLVFATLEVIALVLVSRRFYSKRDTFELVDDSDVRASSSENMAIKPANHSLVQPQIMKKIDMGMRLVYPVAFLLFCIVFFIVLLA